MHDLTYRELEKEMHDFAPVHVRTVWRGLYRDPAAPSGYPARVAQWLQERGGSAQQQQQCEVIETRSSADGLTRKFLLRLADNETVETVLMGYRGRSTACVSTQVGCAMGCVFCATGQMGFVRHLRPAEIVAQVVYAQLVAKAAGETSLRNVVLMGMGEPLHNYDAVMSALEIISDTRGLNIGPRRITISTVGLVPGILRLAEEQQPYRLAVSLHAADQTQRAALVPVSCRWPLPELIEACRIYTEKTGRRIFFEWTLINGGNDSTAHATELTALLSGMDAHVNLIPLNPTSGFNGSASLPGNATHFQRTLRAAGIPSTVRQHRGIDVAAGCGQLRQNRGTGEI